MKCCESHLALRAALYRRAVACAGWLSAIIRNVIPA